MIALDRPLHQTAVAAGREGPDGSTTWIWWNAAAMFATLAHVFIDLHIGLWGASSREMSMVQASNAFVWAALYGWWLLVVLYASRGERWALRSVLVLVGIYAVLLNGLVAFIVAPPPSAAFPYQDIAHGLSLTFGLIATVMVWRALPRASDGGRKGLFAGTVVLIVLGQITGLLAFLSGGGGS